MDAAPGAITGAARAAGQRQRPVGRAVSGPGTTRATAGTGGDPRTVAGP